MFFILSSVVLLVGVIVTPPNLADAQKLDGEVYPNQGICGRKDIRNNVNALEELRNCSIIVGSLHIVLMDDVTESQIAAYSFPELREVTQYVLFYKVGGLRSLGQLFPNLVIIRGQKLFMNYSFIIFYMMDLEEIGLKSLTIIQRGAVRIERNSKLCLVRSVSWELITGLSVGHYFAGNGPSICPGSDTCRGCDENVCWNSKSCQRFPALDCPDECLAGCTKITKLCYRCKDYIYNGSCVSKCPNETYLYQDANHCISKKTCNRMFRSTGWIWNNTCIQRCPKGYSEENINNTKTCVQCYEKCNLVCDGLEVTSLSQAQHLRGCTIINGSLEIRFLGNHSNVMSELEEFFGDIEEITGFLKVYRSISITSLSFLKSLKIIHAEVLEDSRFALSVYEMNNLQYLWTWNESRNLTIKEGTVFFHYNAKLCLSEIEELKRITKIETTEFEVSPVSNGYKMTCHLLDVPTNSHVIDTNTVTITWDRPAPNSSNQTILGYLIYYLENPDDDISTDFGRDSCFEHGWKYYFYTEPSERLPTKLSHNITDLMPSTKYAFYVETYNGAKGGYMAGPSKKHGQSVIKFFTTKMAVPSMPMNVLTASFQPDSISVFWKTDPDYRGTITRHLIELHIQLDMVEEYDKRNYCEHPLNPPPKEDIKTINLETFQEEIADSEQNCTCPGIKPFWEQITEKNELRIQTVPLYTGKCVRTNTTLGWGEIYDKLNQLKCISDDEELLEAKNQSEQSERKKRKVDDFQIPTDMVQHGSTTPRPVLRNVTQGDRYHYFSTDFRTTHKNYTAYKLRPFTRYLIKFALCMGDEQSDCGAFAINMQRTKRNSSKDLVNDLKVTVVNDSAAKVHWKEPSDVNGVILTYTLEYKRLEVKNFKPVLQCITRKQHEDSSFTYLVSKLLPGKYSVRVRPTSLAGNGNFTESIHFVITETRHKFNWGTFFGVSITLFVIAGGLYYLYKRRRTLCVRPEDTDALINRRRYHGVRFAEDDDSGRVEFVEDF